MTERFAFKQARRVPRDRRGCWVMGASLARLSSSRNQRRDQFTKYRLYCGFIILFTVSSGIVYFAAAARPLLNPRIRADAEQKVCSLCIFIGLLFRRNPNPSIDRQHNARHRRGCGDDATRRHETLNNGSLLFRLVLVNTFVNIVDGGMFVVSDKQMCYRYFVYVGDIGVLIRLKGLVI